MHVGERVSILMNELVASNRDVMQVGERYDHSYECVGDATWKGGVANTHSAYISTNNTLN